MKIFYTTAQGKKVDLDDYSDIDNARVVDLDLTRSIITQGISEHFDDMEVIETTEPVSAKQLEDFDLVLCDLTSGNPNVLFEAGLAAGIGLPVIYIISSESIEPAALDGNKILTYTEASLKGGFLNILYETIQAALDNPSTLFETRLKDRKQKIFISYSHQDKEYLDRLMVHLKPLMRRGMLDVWADTKIKTGDHWREEIQKALDSASVAILLVSADFMASDFIIDNELPPLLSKAEVNGTRILPVIVSPCRFTREPELSRFQSANDPSTPLSTIPRDEREIIYDKLMAEVERGMKNA